MQQNKHSEVTNEANFHHSGGMPSVTACGTEGSRQTSAPAAQITTASAETAAQPADTTESVTAEAETAAPAESTVEYRVALNHMMRGIDAEPADGICRYAAAHLSL